MSFELGTAFVKVEPNMSGFEKKVGGGIGSAVSGMLTGPGGMGSALDSLGGKITSTIGTGLKIGVGAAVAGLGTAVTLGVQRLMGIEEAQVKIKSLGYTGQEVDSIMKDVLASVKGTPYALADAAGVGASALAAGIPPGKELERTLSLVGDAATISGRDFTEMGLIWNKVAASNRVSMNEVNSLMASGIPILQWLAEEYGVTAEEAREMVSKGKVNFADFQNAMEKNLGGAAQNAGSTVRGSFENMKAAAGRFGAALIGPIFNNAAGFFSGVTGWIDKMTEKVGPFAELFAERLGTAIQVVGNWVQTTLVPAFMAFGEYMTSTVFPVVMQIVEWFDRNSEAIMKVVQAAVPAVAAMAGLAVAWHQVMNVVRLVSMLNPWVLGLTLVAGALMYAWQNSETFREIVGRAFELVKSVVEKVVKFVTGLITGFGDSNEKTGSKLGEIWERVKGVFGAAMDFIAALVDRVTKIVSWVWENFGDTILKQAKNAWDFIMNIVSAALKIIQGVIEVVTGIISGDWSKVWEGIKNVFGGIWEAIKAILSFAWNTIKNVFSLYLDWVKAIWGTVWGWVSDFFSNIWNAIKDFFSNLLSTMKENLNENLTRMRENVTNIFNAVKEFFVNIWNSIKEFFANLWATMRENASENLSRMRENITNVFNAVKEFFTNLWNSIRDFFSNTLTSIRETATNAWNAIQNLITTVTNAISSVITSVWNAISNTISSVMSAISSVISSVWNAIRSTITSVVTAVLSTVTSIFNSIRTTITNAVNNARTAATNAFNGMRTAVTNTLNSMMNFVKGIPGKIAAVFKNAASLLLNAGKNIINGLWNGIKSVASKPVDAVRGVVSQIRNLLPFSPAKEGPFSGKGAPMFSGQAIAGDLADGIEKSEKAAVSAAHQMARKTARQLGVSASVGVGAHSLGAAGGLAAGRGGDTFHVNVELRASDLDEFRDVTEFFDNLRMVARQGVDV